MAAATSNDVSLDDRFLYQNATTGEPSKKPLSVKQLCKLVASGVLSRTTLVLSVLPDNTYGSTWQSLSQVDILREASSQWHISVNGEQKGPFGIKVLREHLTEAAMMWSPQLPDDGWKPLSELTNLALGMKSLEHEVTLQSLRIKQEHEQRNEQVVEKTDDADAAPDKVQDELEAFLSSTGGGTATGPAAEPEEEEESYQSDNGTTYVKDPVSGKWIHEALFKLQQQADETEDDQKKKQSKKRPAAAAIIAAAQPKKKKNRNKFAARNAKSWIYVAGLPLDTTVQEVAQLFVKAGILDLDPDSQQPKVKLYKDKESGMLKGDASICFARPESVDLALKLFDDSPFRLDCPDKKISVTRAKFEAKAGGNNGQPKRVSAQKRNVVKLAALQAVGWDEGDNGRITGGKKGLTIVVVKGLFQSKVELNDEKLVEKVQSQIYEKSHEWGTIEKLTVFSANGVVLVRFQEASAATRAISEWNGANVSQFREDKVERGNLLQAHFWDGVTDYTERDIDQERKEEDERHEEFGEWLETEGGADELPEELRLRVAE